MNRYYLESNLINISLLIESIQIYIKNNNIQKKLTINFVLKIGSIVKLGGCSGIGLLETNSISKLLSSSSKVG